MVSFVPHVALAQEDAHRFDVFDDEEEQDEQREETPDDEVVIDEEPPPPPPPVPPEPAPETESAQVTALILPDSDEGMSLASRIGAALTRRLATAVGGRPKPAAELMNPNFAEDRRAEIERGLAAISRGTTAFEDLDLQKALEELELGAGVLLSHQDTLDTNGRSALHRALLLLGVTALYDGDGAEADRFFVALALNAPRFEPGPAEHPSNVIERYAAVRAGLEQRATGTLRVETMPSGATVIVDGVVRGASPLEIGGLADGRHSLVIDRLGSKTAGALASVNGGTTSALELDLEPLPGASVLSQWTARDATEAKRAIAAGRDLGVDRLALLRLDGLRREVEGWWVDAAGDRAIARVVKTKVGEDAEVSADAILAAIAGAEEAQRRAVASPVAAVEGDGTDLVDRWWFWALVGGSALIAATAVTIAVVPRDGPPSNSFILGF